MSRLWMVAYDISDNKTRKKIHDRLRDHGQRVQYSVFECRLTDKQLRLLRQALTQLIDSDDTLRWYPLCSWCETDIHWQGSGKMVDTDEFFLV